ncbi:hypothetical protein Cpir12675_003896 [Ceratocystis pirilliformis]|uniref:Ras guanine nucleotide exchange factor A n=1 Tax=Ceratocystis pirilliformis TaxID=259994 RepID=A0ABR3Z1H1_9PEZI
MDSRAHRRSVLSQKSSSESSGSHTTASRSTHRSLVFDHESSLFISPALSPASIADDSCADSIWFLDLDSPSLPPDLPAVPHHTDYRKPSFRHSALHHNNSPSYNAKTAHSRAQSDAHACDRTKLSVHPPALHSNRESFVSIVNDPFFQSLQLGSSPDAPSLDSIAQTIAIEEAHRARDKQLDIAYTTSFIDTEPDPDFDSEGQLDELPYVEEEVALSPRYSGPAKVFHAAGQQDWARFQRRQSLMIDPMHPGQSRYSHSRKYEPTRSHAKSRSTPTTQGTSKAAARKPQAMDGLNIAVVGASGVGKSAFIQQVVGLSRPPLSDATTLSFAINNTTYPVTLFELNLEAFDFGPAQPFQWPKQINGHITPQVDGALILYDVTNIESTRDLHKTLNALTNSSLPAVLVACKCDRPPNCREVNAEVMANHERFKACAGSVASSSNNPEQARIGLSTILRAALHMRREAIEPPYRRRAASTANLEVTPFDANHHSSRPLSQQSSKHSRASSDMSVIRGFSSATHNPDQYRARSPRGAFPSSSEIFGADIEEHSPEPPSPIIATPTTTSTSCSSFHGKKATNISLNSVTSSDCFLDMDESDGEPSSSRRGSDDVPILQRDGDALYDMELDRSSAKGDHLSNTRNQAAGVTLDDLINRLLALRMAKAEHNFANVFLCMYRKFAAPGDLFARILTRLDHVRDDKTQHYLTKTATQLRIVDVVVRWVSLYPGDFARPATRRNLREFVRNLATEPIFAIAAQQIQTCLASSVVDDDDTGWEMSDDPTENDADRAAAGQSVSDMFSGIIALRLEDDDRMPLTHGLDLEIHGHSSLSATSGIQCHYNSVEDYERAASKLVPVEMFPMNKARFHQFMEISNEEVVSEMTRIDWIMFSSIRVRDLIRYVSLSAQQKAKAKSLKNVNRMIMHFNHIARWVANMILLRDKPKHRAQIFEKFIDIAHRLRGYNNYNGLAAVLAGLNSTSIHRLAQTKALLPADAQKQLAMLTLLMATQKSYFAYRLAWENSPLPRIPFIPLHLRDLVSAEEGNSTLVSSDKNTTLINWAKFDVLGEVLLPIMRSQGMEYSNLRRNESVRELLLECRMPTDEDEIYARSTELESTLANSSLPPDSLKKKFPWFAK